MYTKILVVLCLLSYSLSTLAVAKESNQSLIELRANFKTQLIKEIKDNDVIEAPPGEIFSLVKYRTPIGDMSAYLSRPNKENKKQAAIIWISGGFPSGGTNASAWKSVSPDNDQSAKIYRQMGIVMMYPFLRGSAGNPGFHEGFFGEVDDVISALKYLQQVPYVDPKRIYLGGHSTGATLALIAAATSKEFKAVFAFGAVADPLEYGKSNAFHDTSNENENKLRAPINYLNLIKTPTYIIEGNKGNIESLQQLQRASNNPLITFIPIKGANHFETLAPINRFIASAVSSAGDNSLKLDAGRIQPVFDEFKLSLLEASDLQLLANMRRSGVDLNKPRLVSYYLLARSSNPLEKSSKDLDSMGFKTHKIETRQDSQQKTFYLLIADKKLQLINLKSVFANSATLTNLSEKHQIHYDGWDIH